MIVDFGFRLPVRSHRVGVILQRPKMNENTHISVLQAELLFEVSEIGK